MTRRTATTASPRAAVTALSEPAAEAAITAAIKILGMPTIREESSRMADAAAREQLSHKALLAEVLTAECDDRDARRRIRRVNEAKFPRTKRLELVQLRQPPGGDEGCQAEQGQVDADLLGFAQRGM